MDEAFVGGTEGGVGLDQPICKKAEGAFFIKPLTLTDPILNNF